MNRWTSALLLAALLSGSALRAQDTKQLDNVKDLPAWVVELSNIPKDQREKYIRNFTYAKEAYKESKWLECLGYLNSCELIFDKNPNIWNLKAGSLIEQEQYKEAEALCLRAQEYDPKDSVVLLNLSSIYLATGEFQKGYDMLASILKTLHPERQKDLYNIMLYRQFLCLIMMDKQEEARKLVAHTRPMDETPLYYFSQGTLYVVAGDRARAKGELDSADRIFVGYPLLRAYHKGMMLSEVIEKYIRNPK